MIEVIWLFVKKFAPLLAGIALVSVIWISGEHHGKRVIQQEWDQQTARLAVAEANRLRDQAARDKQADDALAMAASQIALLRDSTPTPTLLCKSVPAPVPAGQPAGSGSVPAGNGTLPEAQSFTFDSEQDKHDAAECDEYIELFRSVLAKWPR